MSTIIEQARKEFADMSTAQRATVTIGGALELTAKIASWIDLSRRPSNQVRGPKWLWATAQLINGLGPVAYWTIGRK
ncbi:PLDc N-terminal domain-containing protein [Corynebacterium yudongzhengii]|nr:PLDc N-terminal domain-containing protein [Corynebacterium yudongzhengii]